MPDTENRPKSGQRKWLKWLVVGTVLIVLVALISLTLVAKKLLTVDTLVEKFEETYNCRLQVGEFKVSGLTGTTKIELKNVALAARDAVADAGTPHDQRTPIGGGVLMIGSVTLEADASDLLQKKISVREINVGGLTYYSVIQKDGSHALDPLFDPPVTINGAPNPKFEEKMKRRTEAKERKKLSKEEREKLDKEKEFNIAELPMPATMERLRINDSRIDLKLRTTKARIAIYDIDLSVSNVDFDPADLANHNSAEVKFSASLDLEDNERTVKHAELKIASDGTVVPFDAVTGEVNPDISYTISVLQGSRIEEIPALVKVGKEKLQKYGVVLDIGRNLVIEKDATMAITFRNSELWTVGQTVINFSGHQLTLEPESWWNSGTNQHRIPGQLLVSKEVTADARGQAEKFLADKFGLNKALVKEVAGVLLTPLMRDEQLWMPFTSSGDFSKPKVVPQWGELLDATEILKEEAKGKAMELLEGLLGE
jgi:mRNA-degrading endonuclease RelE of RelBE toxin-antitoxin system